MIIFLSSHSQGQERGELQTLMHLIPQARLLPQMLHRFFFFFLAGGWGVRRTVLFTLGILIQRIQFSMNLIFASCARTLMEDSDFLDQKQ